MTSWRGLNIAFVYKACILVTEEYDVVNIGELIST